MPGETRTWSGPTERIDRVLAELGLARSRSGAVELISQGAVLIDGAVARKAGTRVIDGALVETTGDQKYVSRAAQKLVAGLDGFNVDAKDSVALDLGASTGGFTQVLLERGARIVLAIDVGHDQLAPEIRADPRVRVVEGFNARELTRERLAEHTGITEPPDLIVADLSFISLELVLPAIAAVAAPKSRMVLLIKPQFEVGRTGVRDGIVIDPTLAHAAVERVVACAQQRGLRPGGLLPSPITGEHGNQEFLAYFEMGGTA